MSLFKNGASAAYKGLAIGGAFLMAASRFATVKLNYINSDNAWLSAIGRAMAEGNIILANWIDSTINHAFPYGVVEAFWSLLVHSYRDVHALSVTSLVVIFAYVLFLAVGGLLGRRPHIFSILSLAAIVVAMDSNLLSDTLTHISPALLTLGAACLYYGRREAAWAKWLMAGLLAFWTDNYNLAYFLAPLILENLAHYGKTKKLDPWLKWVAMGLAVYLIRRELFRHTGFIVPGRNISGAFEVINYGDLPLKLSNVYLSLSALFSANFWGLPLRKAVFGLYFAAALFLSLYVQAARAAKLLGGEYHGGDKRFMAFLLLGSALVLGVCLFSKLGLVLRQRYFCGLFINCLIFLGYWLNAVSGGSGRRLGLIFAATLIAALAWQISHHRYMMDWRLAEMRRLARVIRAENLHGGYAWFGNALSMNCLLDEQRVATLVAKSANKPRLWMIDKKAFYHPEKFDFVLAYKEGLREQPGWPEVGWGWPEQDLPDEEIRAHFGPPKKVIEEGDHRIYVFDDITDKVEKPGLE